VIAPHVGGGFGGKAGVTMEIIPAALAPKLKGYAVKLRYSREQNSSIPTSAWE
jgi:carbon-monoxide dehydrogenase large subunit